MKVFTTLFLFLSVLWAFSQNPNNDSLFNKQFEQKNIEYKLTAGSTYLSFGNNKQMFCSYFHPQASYSINSRFRLNIGGMFVNTNIFGFQPNSEGTGYVPANSGMATFLTIGGTYQAGSKLFITGSIMKNIGNVNATLFPVSNIYSLDLEYKINKELSIGVEINYIQSNGSIFPNRNPYSYGNGLFSPFNY
ncbi:MAG: hypothetical protein JXR58_03640 [Bacteroidales bacterium]|nr:hypothetical protein [Bacteroidales bacterium]